MNIYALRVYNSTYGLGLSPEDFTLIEKELLNPASGLANIKQSRGFIIYIDHDDKNKIYVKRSKIKIPTPSRILVKTLTTLWELPEEIYLLHSIARYHANDWKYTTQADTLETLKTAFIDRMMDGYNKGVNTLEQMNSLFWLFNEAPQDLTKIPVRVDVQTIVKVFSADNRRMALFKHHTITEKWSHNMYGGRGRFIGDEDNVSYDMAVFSSRDPRYNYVSPGRETISMDAWLDDPLAGKVTPAEMTLIKKRIGEEDYNDDYDDRGRKHSKKFTLLTADKYAEMQNSLRVEMLTAKREEQQEDVQRRFRSEAEKKYLREKKFIRAGITFTPTTILFGELKLSGPKISEYINHQNLIISQNEDYNSIVAGYIDYTLERNIVSRAYREREGTINVDFTGKASLFIGKVMAKIEKREKVMYLNDKRVRTDELADLLLHALKFSTQVEYDAYVLEASTISLRLMKVIKNGLYVELIFARSDDNELFPKDGYYATYNLKVVREDKKNYLLTAGKKLRIKDVEKFLLIGRKIESSHYSRSDVVDRLCKLLQQSIDGITPEEISILIEEGKKQFDDKIKRSKSFMKEAVRLTGARNHKQGYMVKGESGAKYLVERNLHVHVWEKNHWKYLCLIDVDSDTKSEAGINDCIAKRLLALRHDVDVAKKIYTLGDGVDKYWVEQLPKVNA